jgi:translation initiation factor 2 beta subunit (eIF-2beta)/eIF-5
MVRDGDRIQATQAVFAGAVKNSRLLGDFMDITLREQRASFAKKLEYRMWNDYIAGCLGRDPDMPHWSDATVARLRSAVFSMLAEAGYLKDTRSLLLQNVFVDAQLAAYLRACGETYVLRCMEVAE